MAARREGGAFLQDGKTERRTDGRRSQFRAPLEEIGGRNKGDFVGQTHTTAATPFSSHIQVAFDKEGRREGSTAIIVDFMDSENGGARRRRRRLLCCRYFSVQRTGLEGRCGGGGGVGIFNFPG